MANMSTTTDHAATIRAAYKAKGWSSRDISVRAEYYSMGSSIHVRIKNADVPFAVVEQIATQAERIDRDQFGEILSGGNRFVHVSYSPEAEAILTARYAATVKAAAQQLDAECPEGGRLFPIGDTGFLIGRGYNGWGYSLWKDGHIQTANAPEHLASLVAIRLQAAEGGR